ncbi:MAG: hypothetical protein HY894_06735 [Deltaproteobacteria bacterium]|nr:hypothetical protein [Deltaproteobacteria bacterium]
MDATVILIAVFMVFFTVSALAAAILWFMAPLSVFGMKGLLRKSVEEQEKTNRLLQTLADELRHGVYREREETPYKRDDKTDRVH